MPDAVDAVIDIPELRVPFVFRRRPVPIPGDLRPAWRIALIVLLMRKCCRQNRTSRTRLHVLSWGFLSPDGREQLQAAVERRLRPDALIVRFEPFLEQAIAFAVGEELLRVLSDGRVELTESGVAFANELDSDESVLVQEKELMEILRSRLTEQLVNDMFGWRA